MPNKPFRPNQFDGVQLGMVGWLGKRIAVCPCHFKLLSSWNTGTLGLCICAYITSKKMNEIIIIITIKKERKKTVMEFEPSTIPCRDQPLLVPIANAYKLVYINYVTQIRYCYLHSLKMVCSNYAMIMFTSPMHMPESL